MNLVWCRAALSPRSVSRKKFPPQGKILLIGLFCSRLAVRGAGCALSRSLPRSQSLPVLVGWTWECVFPEAALRAPPPSAFCLPRHASLVSPTAETPSLLPLRSLHIRLLREENLQLRLKKAVLAYEEVYPTSLITKQEPPIWPPKRSNKTL